MSKKMFNFDDEFKLGIELVDREHAQLVDMLNHVYDLLGEGKRAEARAYFNQALTDYIDVHFSDEEAFMAEIGYPHLEEHKRVHEQFKQNFYSLKPMIESDDNKAFRQALSDAFSWLLVHIGKSDRRYANFLKEQGKL